MVHAMTLHFMDVEIQCLHAVGNRMQPAVEAGGWDLGTIAEPGHADAKGIAGAAVVDKLQVVTPQDLTHVASNCACRDGYDKWGYDDAGYDKSGYDKWGYDKDGFDKCVGLL